MRGLLGIAALMLFGCATVRADTDTHHAEAMDDLLAGRVAGPASRCISAGSGAGVGGPTIIGENLVYRDGGRLWVNRPIAGCTSLRGDPILIVEVNGGQLCTGDRFRTVERSGIGIPGPYCRFGAFVPYMRPDR